MFVNGVPIGSADTKVILKRIQKELQLETIVWFAVVVGLILRAIVKLRFEEESIQTIGTLAAGSGLFYPQFVEASQSRFS
jgi:hypothetical protein